MRIAISALMFVLFFGANVALAGGVLVPGASSDNKSGGFSSLFGYFSPKPSSDSVSNTATPAQTAPVSSSDTKQIVAPSPVAPPPSIASAPASSVIKADNKNKAPVPPRIFDEINTGEFVNRAQGANNIAMGFAPQYALSASDYSEIQKKLGYSPVEAKAYCKLGATLTFNLGGGNNEVDIREYRLASGVQIQGNYDGIVRKVMVRLAVLCKPPASLPQAGQIIFKSGDLYSVHLMSISNCVPERPRPTSLLIQYNGNGQTGCLFKY